MTQKVGSMFTSPWSAIVMITACFVVAVAAWTTVDSYRYQHGIGDDLRSELGFAHASPSVQDGEEQIEVMALENVDPDGRMAQAGVRDGDIPVSGLSVTGFYRMLSEARGGRVEFQVVSSTDDGPISERPKRLISMAVPKD